jgi:hypothetical protein
VVASPADSRWVVAAVGGSVVGNVVGALGVSGSPVVATSLVAGSAVAHAVVVVDEDSGSEQVGEQAAVSVERLVAAGTVGGVGGGGARLLGGDSCKSAILSRGLMGCGS